MMHGNQRNYKVAYLHRLTTFSVGNRRVFTTFSRKHQNETKEKKIVDQVTCSCHIKEVDFFSSSSLTLSAPSGLLL